MRRPLAAIAALALLAFAGPACTVSRVKPEANVDIGGTVRTADAAVPGARLVMQREGDVGDVVLTIASIGFACLDSANSPAICHKGRFATANPSGAFVYHVKGRDTQSTFGGSAVLSISTALPATANEAAGASTTYRFHVQTEKVDLPIRLWDPAVDAGLTPAGVQVTFPPPAAGLIPRQLNLGVRYTVEFIRGSEVVWRVFPAQPGVVFDPRLLEDSTGTMRVIASASRIHVTETLGDEVAFAMRSGARSYVGSAGTPLSRGAPCSVVAAGKSVRVAPCRLTDGAFGDGFAPVVCSGSTACTEPPHESAIVDLQRSARVDLIVVRGCTRACRVEASLDGADWRLIGVGQGNEAAFALAQARSERYVRVSGPNEVDQLTEVSVWGPAKQSQPRSLLVAPTPSPAARGTVPAPTKTRSTVWIIVAVGILGAVSGGLIVWLARRRAPAR